MAIQAKCEKCGKDYLIINKEIDFYKEKDFPLPKKCPTCRLERRVSLRNKKELFGYNCDKCGKDIVIAFEPPEGQEVYCKACHQEYMQNHDCILGYSEGAKSQQNSSAPSSEAASPAPSAQSTGQENSTNEVADPVGW